MKLKASDEAKEQREFARNALSTSIFLQPPDDPTHPELGEFRDRAVLDLLYVCGYTLPEIACRAVGARGWREHTAHRINRLVDQGLIEKIDFTSKHYRQLIMLTKSGYRYIEEIREDWRISLEANGTIGVNPLPSIPMARPSRIAFTTLDHDLMSQCLMLDFSGLLAFAPERSLHGFPLRRPDALVQTTNRDNPRKKEIVAIEYDKSLLSKPRTEIRLLDCQRVLIPNLDHQEAEDHDSPGAGGINRWMIVCNSWAQVKKYRNIIKVGKITDSRGGSGRSYDLSKSRFLILHISQFNAPRLRPVIEQLLDGMPRA